MTVGMTQMKKRSPNQHVLVPSGRHQETLTLELMVSLRLQSAGSSRQQTSMTSACLRSSSATAVPSTLLSRSGLSATKPTGLLLQLSS